jgi:hypothetical protein
MTVNAGDKMSEGKRRYILALTKEELAVLAAEHQACIMAAPKTTEQEIDAFDVLLGIRRKLTKMIEVADKPAATPATASSQTEPTAAEKRAAAKAAKDKEAADQT